VVSDRPAYRRCLDELGTGADNSDNLHRTIKVILERVSIS
jgi:hypothetical protein